MIPICRLIAASMAAALAVATQAAEPDWSGYNALLNDHLTKRTEQGIYLTWVDYSALVDDPRFADVLNTLQGHDPDDLSTRQEHLAFYINAYNILTINLIRRHWPVEGIKEIGTWYRPVWNMTAGQLDGQEVTLDQIEHDILRSLGEPRIHFAIVCASLSCPDLSREAYTAADLERQLEDQTRSFLHNPGKGVRVTNDRVRVSRIFDWFEQDFSAEGGIRRFIQRYYPLPEDLPLDANLPYLWPLNGS